MSLKKYMFIDLLMTGIIGVAVEFLGVFVFNKMIPATIIPFAISLLIMMISTTRWGSRGLILVPFLALSTVLSGKLINPTEALRTCYDWKLYVSLIVSLSTFSLNFCWFDFRKKRNIKESMGSMVGLAILDIVIATIMLVSVYYILTGNPSYILAFPVWGFYGYAMLVIGTCILFTQGVLVNVKQKLLDEKNLMLEEDDFHMCLDDEEDSSVEKGVLECKK